MQRKIPKKLENGNIYFTKCMFSVAPFNSILEREKAYKMNENPGPGTYATEQVKIV